MTRRQSAFALFLCAGLCFGRAAFPDDGLAPHPVESFEQLQAAARALAAEPYQPQPAVPDALKNLTYDEFRYIGFRNDKSIWKGEGLPFQLGFYHKGYVHLDDVAMNLLLDGKEHPLPFSRDYFHYLEKAQDLKLPDDIGFAGFRVECHPPGKTQFEELFSFVGASYFRARPATEAYGTSARGLAIDVGLPKNEEFPVFREYWIAKPKHGDTSLKVFALLDSPSVAGAYEFVLTPGEESSEIDVHATLYFRGTPEKVGIAPMSSMWMWGDGLDGPEGDHRPEVHDADGLQVEAGDGSWLWRAFCRQTYPSLVRLNYDNIKGFGLLQRDIDPQHYLDDEAKYDARPSVWIEPKSDWGPGAVELLELPAPHEGIDNIAAWWTPSAQVAPGEPVDLSYRISFFRGDRPNHALGKATGYRVRRDRSGIIQVEIDFQGGDLERSKDVPAPVPQVTSIRGAVNSTVCREYEPGVWTVELEIAPTGEGPVELTTLLKDGDRVLTETWAYLCPLEPPPTELPPWRVKEIEEKKAAEAANTGE